MVKRLNLRCSCCKNIGHMKNSARCPLRLAQTQLNFEQRNLTTLEAHETKLLDLFKRFKSLFCIQYQFKKAK